MKYEIEKIREFREKFNLGVHSKQVDYELHKTLIKEELYELIEAVELKDYANIQKELVDVMYVTIGLILDLGHEDSLPPMFDATVANNLAKLGKDGKPIYRDDGKLEKPKGFIKLNPQDVFDEVHKK